MLIQLRESTRLYLNIYFPKVKMKIIVMKRTSSFLEYCIIVFMCFKICNTNWIFFGESLFKTVLCKISLTIKSTLVEML